MFKFLTNLVKVWMWNVFPAKNELGGIDLVAKTDLGDYWARGHSQPSYILDFLLSVINVSVQTTDLVASLPTLTFPILQLDREYGQK